MMMTSIYDNEQFEEGVDDVHQHFDKGAWHQKKVSQTQIENYKNSQRRINKSYTSSPQRIYKASIDGKLGAPL